MNLGLEVVIFSVHGTGEIVEWLPSPTGTDLVFIVCSIIFVTDTLCTAAIGKDCHARLKAWLPAS